MAVSSFDVNMTLGFTHNVTPDFAPSVMENGFHGSTSKTERVFGHWLTRKSGQETVTQPWHAEILDERLMRLYKDSGVGSKNFTDFAKSISELKKTTDFQQIRHKTLKGKLCGMGFSRDESSSIAHLLKRRDAAGTLPDLASTLGPGREKREAGTPPPLAHYEEDYCQKVMRAALTVMHVVGQKRIELKNLLSKSPSSADRVRKIERVRKTIEEKEVAERELILRLGTCQEREPPKAQEESGTSSLPNSLTAVLSAFVGACVGALSGIASLRCFQLRRERTAGSTSSGRRSDSDGGATQAEPPQGDEAIAMEVQRRQHLLRETK